MNASGKGENFMSTPTLRVTILRCLSFVLCLAALGAPPPAQSQELPEPAAVQRLDPILVEEGPDGTPEAPSIPLFFGTSVSAFGNTLLVGIPGFRDQLGRVGIFRRNESGQWQREGSIESPGTGTNFGVSVSLTRSFAFVGFLEPESFGTHVYRRTKHGFQLLPQAALPASFAIDEPTGRIFTTSQRTDGSTLAKLSVLDKRGQLHTVERFVIPSELTADPQRQAALWDDIYVLTNPSDNDSQGAAYVFEKRQGRWHLRQKLIAADGDANDQFGSAVTVHGDTIVVSAFNADRPQSNPDCFNPDSGAVYVFKRRHGLWVEDQKLDPAPDPFCVTNFGDRLFFSGKVLLVMDNRPDNFSTDIGWHVFERRFGRYELTAYRVDTVDRGTTQTFEMQRSTLFEGNAREGCCYEIGRVLVWDLTP
jgi:hypothetical protein